MEHGLGIVYGPAGPISLSAVFSSLVSSMGTTDVAGRRIGDMRSDGVHGSLKTTGMASRASRHEDPEALVFASFFSSFHPIFRFKGGGVFGNAWRRHPSRPITPGTK